MAKAAPGSVFQVGDGATPEKFTDLGGVVEVSGGGVSREMLEATELDDTSPDFLAGLTGPVDCTVRLMWDPDDDTHLALKVDALAGTTRNFRLCLSDYGTSLAATVVLATDVWTTAAHGWLTGQPVRFVTTGTIPTSTPQIVQSRTYYARVTSATEFTLHLTAADAVANANIINFTADPTPALHSITRSQRWSFAAKVMKIDPAARKGQILEATLSLRLIGAVAVT